MLFFIEGAGTWELGTDRWYPWPQVNVPPLTLSQPLLLGIACNETSAGRASAEFYVLLVISGGQNPGSWSRWVVEGHG